MFRQGLVHGYCRFPSTEVEFMPDEQSQPGDATQLAPGLSLSDDGEVTVAAEMSEVLFDVAIRLEDATELPVDVQHVVAALLLAVRSGTWDSSVKLSADDAEQMTQLSEYVRAVFVAYGGDVGE